MIDNINNYDNEIGLKDLLLVLWNYKLAVISITLICSISSVFYAISLPNIYTSSAILAPASSSGENNSIGSSLSQYSSLASIAGVSMPSGTSGGTKISS